MAYGIKKGVAKEPSNPGVKKSKGNWEGHPSTKNPLFGNRGHSKGKKKKW